TDVLGRRAVDHLIESVARVEDVAAGIVVAGDAALAKEMPNVPVRSVADLRELRPAGGAILLLDARCWFSREALENLFARAAESTDGLRVVPGRRGKGPGRIETLALCLSSGGERAGLLRPDGAAAAAGLEDLLSAAILRSAATCEAGSLDRESPPFAITGYEGIAELERQLLLERAVRAMRAGVRIRDPRTIYI